MSFASLAFVAFLLLWSESGCAPQSEPNENSSTAHVGSSVKVGKGGNSARHSSTRTSGTSNKVNDANVITPQLTMKWVSAALKHFDFHSCTSTNIGSDDECFKLGQLGRDQVAVYLGHARRGGSKLLGGGHPGSSQNGTTKVGPASPPTNLEKVFAILPDSNSAKASGGHDAVLVLDPYPNATFGHLVAMFYLDFVTANECRDDFQTFTSDGTCLTVGRKARCPNSLERFTPRLQPKRCHVDFLPTVYTAERVAMSPLTQGKADLSRYPDLLECVPLSGFAPCPKLRSVEDTTKVLCDTTLANSKRCDTSHATVGSTCKLFQSCDRAILIGGGWNRAHSPVQSLTNIAHISDSLIKNSGFSPDNIKTFYGNGKISGSIPKITSTSTLLHQPLPLKRGDYFSSAMKTALRGHIRTTCDNRHCADTLFIYLNNPTTFEGDFLLWDVDRNGIADELETYTVKEFLSDLAGCEAKRVVVMVEQSNSDILMASLKSSSDHANVILFTAALPNEVVTLGEFTGRWVNSSYNPTACLRHVYQITASYMIGSNPVFYDTSRNGLSSKLSLVGAPCDLNPPVSSGELKALYQGCQNVPTSIWFSFDFDEIGEEMDLDGGRVGGMDAESPARRDLLGNEEEHPVDNSSDQSDHPKRSLDSERSHHRHHHRHSSSSSATKRRRVRSKSKTRNLDPS